MRAVSDFLTRSLNHWDRVIFTKVALFQSVNGSMLKLLRRNYRISHNPDWLRQSCKRRWGGDVRVRVTCFGWPPGQLQGPDAQLAVGFISV